MPSAVRQALVLGNGRSGKAAAELLRREGASVVVLDGEDAFPEGEFDLCVTSPGVALDHHWQIAARAAEIPVVSELQLGAERWRAMGGRMLAVTGSKGKSSVVKLVADALHGVPCGNYGLPLCELVLDWCKGNRAEETGNRGDENSFRFPRPSFLAQELPWAVVEVSSFQLETTELPGDAFEAAALLNLQEDHLDRHGGVEVYHGLKRGLLEMAKVKVDGTALEGGAVGAGLLESSYFDNPVLRVNGACAIELLRAAGLSDEAIAAAFANFEPLPHRMQKVAEKGGVTWIDDSKATSLAALAAGVEMAAARLSRAESGSGKRILLIAGGLGKGDNPLSVIPRLRLGVKKVYLIGSCADQLLCAWRDSVPCETCGTLDRAVEAARRDAISGDVVLLSPGTASFDQFKSYGARGDAFTALVRAGD